MRLADDLLSSMFTANRPEWSQISPAARAALFAALEAGPHAISLFDAADGLAFSNQAFRIGWAVESSEGATFDSIIRNCHWTKQGAIVATDDIESWLESARQSRRRGPASRSFEVDLWDGRWMWITERRLDDGWILTVAQDISAIKHSERTLRLARDAALQASLTDPLTQMPNRRSAMQVLQSQIDQGEPFNVALTDIDNFKIINDRYGHTVGDEVLVALSVNLLQLQSLGYFASRLAGDEFLIISAPKEEKSAFELTLRALLTEYSPSNEVDGKVRFCISIGAASFPSHGADAKQLLTSADEAMYQAKSAGRCTLRFFELAQ